MYKGKIKLLWVILGIGLTFQILQNINVTLKVSNSPCLTNGGDGTAIRTRHGSICYKILHFASITITFSLSRTQVIFDFSTLMLIEM